MTMTRAQLDDAIRVVREGRGVHGLYAYEDARSDLKNVARYFWRHSTLMVLFVSFGSTLAVSLLPDWPFYARHFLGAFIGAIASLAVEELPLVGTLLAPSGLVASDVRRAMRYAYAPT